MSWQVLIVFNIKFDVPKCMLKEIDQNQKAENARNEL